MTTLDVVEKAKSAMIAWGEELEPPATDSEIQELADRIHANYSIHLPVEYLEFLKIANGLEFNGVIIYGTKNSVVDSDASPLDLIEMNEVAKGSELGRFPGVITVGENSTGIIVYDGVAKMFQYRDRVGLDRVQPYPSFEEMLRTEIENVL